MSDEAFALYMAGLGYVRVPGSPTTWMSLSLEGAGSDAGVAA